ncbi:peptidoglycan-binding protein [Thalassococcus sp. CAU 1522]|uniref:Peptidoglycan-binding protein n=1 Tax=Thalassococcus arenae TaxID=2851652 RepID=A0ABS6N2I0_9RHOB|nr:peptidoglycan-binding domain-containing protein [Thalassococcus arenae]MBV2358235.1 peptidoglycan-binding protein [Thalassococcus arenae]
MIHKARDWAIRAAALALAAGCAMPQGAEGPVATRAAAPEVGARVETLADGSCRAREVTPAVYEQVMGEVQVVQAEIGADGTVIRPPVYRRAPVPRIVRPRAEISFEAPCPADMTQEFIASVQRALAARGYFGGNVTGLLDGPTTAAIRRYQSERGLQSGQLSLATARDLGLVAVARPGGRARG